MKTSVGIQFAVIYTIITGGLVLILIMKCRNTEGNWWILKRNKDRQKDRQFQEKDEGEEDSWS